MPDPRGPTERAKDGILAGARMMVPEPVSPQVEERIDRSWLVVFAAHRIEILSKELQQFWRIRDSVFLDHPLLKEIEQRKQHHRLMWALVTCNAPNIELAEFLRVGSQ